MRQSRHKAYYSYIDQIIGYISKTSSSLIVIYLWTMLGQRGITADRMHTSGYTKIDEPALAVLIIPLVIVSLVTLYRHLKTSERQRKIALIFHSLLLLVTVLFNLIVALGTT